MEYLKNLQVNSRKEFVPVMLEDGLNILLDVVKNVKPTNILEIGTAVGYSGSVMLQNCNAKLTTIEINAERASLAQETFKKLNLFNRVNIIVGDAGEVIKRINDKYDLIFLDGPKGQYINYIQTLLNLLLPNGIIVADNVLYRGMVLSDQFIKHKHRTMIVNLRKFLNFVQNNNSLKTTLYEKGDGVIIIEKIAD